MSHRQSRPPARTRGLKQKLYERDARGGTSRPPARTRGLKLILKLLFQQLLVASSREDAWIETALERLWPYGYTSRPPARTRGLKPVHKDDGPDPDVASSREDAWIETHC